MFKKNTAVTGFPFHLVSKTDGSDITTGAPVGYYLLDGGTQTAIGDVTPVHEGNGQWTFDLLAAEMNGDIVGLTFTHASAITVHFTIRTDTKIVSELQDVAATDIVSSGAITTSSGRIDVGSWLGTAVTTSSTTNKPEVDQFSISDDATAANNLELQYDTTGLTGDEFPSKQSQLNNISTGSAAINTTASGTEATTPSPVGTPTNSYTSTIELDGVFHSWIPAVGELEFAYNFNIGPNASPVSITWHGYVQSNNDTVQVYARNWVGPSWQQIGEINGTASAAVVSETFDLTTAHVNTGANSGDVRIRFVSTGGAIITTFATDRILCSFTNVNQSAGYQDGAIWFNDSISNENTVDFVDGVADNPVSTWAAALTLNTSLGFNRFKINNGGSVVLTATSDNFTLEGVGWTLGLGSRSIAGIMVVGAHVTGTGTSAGTEAHFTECHMGAATIPPSFLDRCGIGEDSGTLTAGSAGDFVLEDCYSQAPGSAAPTFTFTGLGASTGVNNRGWKGGAIWNVDSDVTISHCVLVGGGTTFNSAGADIETRGFIRELTLTLSAGGTTPVIQHVGVTGPITISGTATSTTVNLYGVSSSLTDTSVNTTVNDMTTSRANYIGGDYSLDTDGNGRMRIADGTGTGELNTDGGRVESDLVYIHGAALTETSGQLSAAFVKLFDVGTPTLVASDVMRGTDGALTDKAGFSLSTAGILAVWHQALSAIVTASSVGKLLKDEITAVRMATLTDWINAGRLDLLLDAIKAKTDGLNFTGNDVKATLDGEEVVTDSASRTASKATGFAVAGDNMAMSASERNALADALLLRNVSNVEGSAGDHSLCYVVLAMSESDTTTNANKLTVFKTDGTTEFVQKTLTTDAAADPLTKVE